MDKFDLSLIDHIDRLNEEFAVLLDNTADPVEGELRVKLARAELILYKISELMKRNLKNEP